MYDNYYHIIQNFFSLFNLLSLLIFLSMNIIGCKLKYTQHLNLLALFFNFTSLLVRLETKKSAFLNINETDQSSERLHKI